MVVVRRRRPAAGAVVRLRHHGVHPGNPALRSGEHSEGGVHLFPRGAVRVRLAEHFLATDFDEASECLVRVRWVAREARDHWAVQHCRQVRAELFEWNQIRVGAHHAVQSQRPRPVLEQRAVAPLSATRLALQRNCVLLGEAALASC